MDKEISLDYSDNESTEVETQTYQPSYDNSLIKFMIIKQRIKALENPRENREFCKICNAELKSQIHAKTHYVSTKHKKNIELLRERLLCIPIETLQENINIARFCIPDSAVPIEEVDSYCKVCNITLVGKLVKENHQNAEIHKRNLERYCEICHVRTISKDALVEHRFFSHRQELQRINHDDDDILAIPAIYVNPKISPKRSLMVATNTQTALQKNATTSCNICHERFKEGLFSRHKDDFTHIVLEQLKIQYPPEIIDAVCYVRRGCLFCSLCDVKLQDLKSTEGHLNHSTHVTRFEKLLQSLHIKANVSIWRFCIPDSAVAVEKADSYCNVCKITLVGTLAMENHQNAEIHKRNLERYCAICQVRTISKEALVEHNFFTHKQEVHQPSSPNDDVLAIPVVSVIPEISPKPSPEVEGNTQTWICYICHITFEEEPLFISHKEVFPHTALEQLKIQYPPEIVDAVCSVSNGRIFCSLCKVTVQSNADTKSHVNCSRHLIRFEKLLQDLFTKKDINNAELDNSDTEMKNDNQEASTECEGTKTEGEVENKDSENNFFYCYLCKMEFDSKANINVHATSFPHVEVAKLKSELISLGVSYAEYWIQSKYYFSCTLCDAKISSAKGAEQHCSGPKHKQRLYRWCREFSTWKCGPVVDPKYFLCKQCNVSLVGTTDAELHYKMKSHLERMELYSEPSSFTNSTEEMLSEHNKSFEIQENISKVLNVQMTSKPSEDVPIADYQENCSHKKPNSPKEKDLLPPLDVSLEQQVYKELEKVVDTLYYSKSLPFHISLKYAKKINKEIRKLKRNYQRKPANSANFLEDSLEYSNGSEVVDLGGNTGAVKNQTVRVHNEGYVPSTSNYWLLGNTSAKLGQTVSLYDENVVKTKQTITDNVEADVTNTCDDTVVKGEETITRNNEADVANRSNCLYDDAVVKTKETITDNKEADVTNTSNCLYDDAVVKTKETITDNKEADVTNTSNCLYDDAVVKTKETITDNKEADVTNTSNCLYDDAVVKTKETITDNKEADVTNTSNCLYDDAVVKTKETITDNKEADVTNTSNCLYDDAVVKTKETITDNKEADVTNTSNCLYDDAVVKTKETITDNKEADVTNTSNCLYDDAVVKTKETITDNKEADVTNTSNCLYDDAVVKTKETITDNKEADVTNTSNCLYDDAVVKTKETITDNNEADIADTSNCLYDNASVRLDVSNTHFSDKVDVSKNVSDEPKTESNARAMKSNSKKKKKCTVDKVFQERVYKPSKSVIDEVGRRLNKEKNDRISETNWVDFVKPVNFKDMLELISCRKSECGTCWDHVDAEVELLNECETLIKFIDSGDVPFDVILWYLRNCNVELQLVLDKRRTF